MPSTATIRDTWSALDPSVRMAVISMIAALSLAGWGYMIYMAWAMDHMHLVDMWMPPRAGMRAWGAYDFLALFVMWLLMMIAMMLPSAAPLAMLFAQVQQKRRGEQVVVPTYMLLAGYIAAWGVFSAVITVLQWQLHRSASLDPMMESQSYLLSGIALLIAGVYQWTPWKDVCLRYCRTPMNFLLGSWREGVGGALVMGLHHGTYCVLCCWGLMLVMFVVGVMNVLWMIVIALFVLLEKTVLPPRGGSVTVGAILLLGSVWWLLERVEAC